MNRQGTSNTRRSRVGLDSIRSNNAMASCRPISLGFWATVVRRGRTHWASGMSSNPTIATSSGTRRFSASASSRAPIAMVSLAAKTAVGRAGP